MTPRGEARWRIASVAGWFTGCAITVLTLQFPSTVARIAGLLVCLASLPGLVVGSRSGHGLPTTVEGLRADCQSARLPFVSTALLLAAPILAFFVGFAALLFA